MATQFDVIKFATTALFLLLILGTSLFVIREPTEQSSQQKPESLLSSTNQTTTCQLANLSSVHFSVAEHVYAGYLAVSAKSTSKLAFTLHGARAAVGRTPAALSEYPLIVWLNGGPGSSSQFGNFLEIGPLRFVGKPNASDSERFRYNDYHWNKNHSLLFIDQPIATGFSRAARQAEIPIDLDQVAQQFLYALRQLYDAPGGCFQNQSLQLPPLQDIFIIGESYAGKFIPAIAQHILEQVEGGAQLPFTLRGIAFGDGFTAPFSIMRQYPKFLKENSKKITQKQLEWVAAEIEKIHAQVEKKGPSEALVQRFFKMVIKILKYAGFKDKYNIKVKQRSLDKLQKELQELFVHDKQFSERLGFQTDIVFDQHKHLVQDLLETHDFFYDDAIDRLEFVLTRNLSVLIYQGDLDFLICEICTLSWLDNLKYEFDIRNAERKDWYYYEDQQIVLSNKIGKNQTKLSSNKKVKGGWHKHAGPLEFIVVSGAGHMVPYDKPAAALAIVSSFVLRVLKDAYS